MTQSAIPPVVIVVVKQKKYIVLATGEYVYIHVSTLRVHSMVLELKSFHDSVPYSTVYHTPIPDKTCITMQFLTPNSSPVLNPVLPSIPSSTSAQNPQTTAPEDMSCMNDDDCTEEHPVCVCVVPQRKLLFGALCDGKCGSGLVMA